MPHPGVACRGDCHESLGLPFTSPSGPLLRNIIERMFGWLKEKSPIVTRFDKLAKSYAVMGSLACAMQCL